MKRGLLFHILIILRLLLAHTGFIPSSDIFASVLLVIFYHLYESDIPILNFETLGYHITPSFVLMEVLLQLPVVLGKIVESLN